LFETLEKIEVFAPIACAIPMEDGNIF